MSFLKNNKFDKPNMRLSIPTSVLDDEPGFDCLDVAESMYVIKDDDGFYVERFVADPVWEDSYGESWNGLPRFLVHRSLEQKYAMKFYGEDGHEMAGILSRNNPGADSFRAVKIVKKNKNK